MSVTIWPANIDKTISVIANNTATISLYIKPNNSNTLFTLVNTTFIYRNNDIWQAVTNFQEGEYLLKITATSKQDTIIGLRVIPNEKYDLTVLQKSLIEKVDSANSWKVVG